MLKQLSAVDILVCAGDIIGYYNQPNECCALIRERANIVVLGNHEWAILRQWKPDHHQKDQMKSEWTRRNLNSDNLEWIAGLPEEESLEIDGYTLKIRHTLKGGGYLYPNSLLLNELPQKPMEIIVLGHTHHPMNIKCGDGFVINPGSVGQPRDRNPAASYAIFDTLTGDTKMHRASYDIRYLQQRLSALEWDEDLIDRLGKA